MENFPEADIYSYNNLRHRKCLEFEGQNLSNIQINLPTRPYLTLPTCILILSCFIRRTCNQIRIIIHFFSVSLSFYLVPELSSNQIDSFKSGKFLDNCLSPHKASLSSYHCKWSWLGPYMSTYPKKNKFKYEQL